MAQRTIKLIVLVLVIGLAGYFAVDEYKKKYKSTRIKIASETCAEQDLGLTESRSKLQIRADVPSIRFAAFGDYGKSGSCELAVSNLVKNFAPDFIITTGDNLYSGPDLIDESIGQYYHQFIGNYDGKFGTGSLTNRFFPSIGNHDHEKGDISAYLGYFDLPGIGKSSSANERYYDFVQGPVHFFAINSTKETEPDGITQTSKQAQWLKNQLASSLAPWKIVYFHHSPFSSSAKHGSNSTLQWDFEEWGATAVLTGHDHLYERILRDDNGDGLELPYFVVGLGGVRNLYKFSEKENVEGSKFRYNKSHGTLLVDATSDKIKFDFYSLEDKGTLVDSYTINRGQN